MGDPAADADAPPKDFGPYIAGAPKDVRRLVEALVDMPKDACPTIARLAARLRWPDDPLWMAVAGAEHVGFVQVWEADGREPAVILGPFSACMNDLELAPNDGPGIPDRFAWMPLDAPPRPDKLKPRWYEARATDLDRDDPIGTLANLADESHAVHGRGVLHGLSDVEGVTVHPADMRGVDRTVLSPLPAGAYLAELVIAHEEGRITDGQYAGRVRRHALPVGMSRAWSARDEDRHPGAHVNDPAGDPREPITMDSPRLAKYDRYGPRKKAEMFAKLQAEDSIGRVDPSKCPACRDEKLEDYECCPLCHRYGADDLGREDRPGDPGDAGIAELDRLNKRFEGAIREMRREDSPPDEETARRREDRAEKRRDRLAIEASRTRRVRGRPPKSG